jgi:hypothetical protein
MLRQNIGNIAMKEILELLTIEEESSTMKNIVEIIIYTKSSYAFAFL